jgi:hypothetical protein
VAKVATPTGAPTVSASGTYDVYIWIPKSTKGAAGTAGDVETNDSSGTALADAIRPVPIP